ncbi:hypothetical protein [Xanthomonas campestris]|uniref:hypothetical protein n=1 Tax=Xanthomonas campestris TaxID=339 RepID=UPI0011C059E2|nr:hypothetical protein [Xanthomonas campestris]MEA9842363.1 hypothetical protein [Xanthomonas campestris pv. raphani]
MKINIRGIREAGNLEKERLVLEAVTDTDIGRFLITRNDFIKKGSVSNKIKNSFWLPDQNVETGQLIVVYTKSGKNIIRENKDESKTHFIYLGLGDPLWEPKDAAVLIEISSWRMKSVDEP